MQKRGSSNPIHHFTRFLTLFALLVGAVPFPPGQEVAGDTQKAAAAAEEQVHIAKQPITVMVTARKEPETALSIPLSVTAVTEGTLRDSDIRAVKDAARFAPNVIINEFTARAVSNPFFRGIGGSPTNPGVSTFIDGVPQLNGFSSNIEMADVAQVEFVRGPGGSLYGRNTAGGFINIISRPASETWTAQTQGAFGNYSYRDIRGSVSSPLLRERFSFNLAGGYSGRDGYTKNDFSNRDLDRRSAGFGKAQLFVKLNEQWKIRWIFTGERDRDGDYALGDIGYIRENPNRVRRDFEGHTRRCVGSTTLRLEYQGDSVDFASISGGLWWKTAPSPIWTTRPQRSLTAACSPSGRTKTISISSPRNSVFPPQGQGIPAGGLRERALAGWSFYFQPELRAECPERHFQRVRLFPRHGKHLLQQPGRLGSGPLWTGGLHYPRQAAYHGRSAV
jgi:iron complex outermembrane receptor protein